MATALSRAGCAAQPLLAVRCRQERQLAADTRPVLAARPFPKCARSSRPRHVALSSSNGQFTAAWGLPALPLRRKDSSRGAGVRCAAVSSADRPASKPRFIQHKQEAFWFYRFLSIVYDHVINPGHWTEDMREDALEVADLNDPNLKVVDVGAGTGEVVPFKYLSTCISGAILGYFHHDGFFLCCSMGLSKEAASASVNDYRVATFCGFSLLSRVSHVA